MIHLHTSSLSYRSDFGYTLEGREDEFPILTRALRNQEAAWSTQVEWVFPHKGSPLVWFNWTQIFRRPFGVSATAFDARWYRSGAWARAVKEQFTQHMLEIEQALRYSRLERRISYRIDEETGELYPYEYKTMGGVEFYLGRELRDDDHVGLRVLQGPRLLERTRFGVDGREAEWLSEISLVVVPGKGT